MIKRALRFLLAAAGSQSLPLLSVIPGASVLAQEPALRSASPTIVSDRPGLGNGAWVVGPGIWQLETGATLADSGPNRAVNGSALLRVGLSNSELRMTLPSPQVSTDSGDTDVADLGVGFKVPLGDGSWRWGLLGDATLPTGSDAGTADEVTGTLTLVGETALGDRAGFTVNLGASAGEHSDATAILVPTLSFRLTNAVSSYAGVAAYFADEQDEYWVETGFAVSMGTDFQWDINSAYDVENDQWFLGIGLAWRWD
ncbi:MAG: transporter [Pseudomonadota bacterium]